MAGEYIWGKNKETVKRKVMRNKPKTKKLTYMSRSPALDKKRGHKGKAYYYILDLKKRRRR